MSDLFIPKKIKVGFQNRENTYTKKLAYVIYFDNKGVLRKEKSWEGWRDKAIKPEEYDNIPQDGFVLNKDVKRYGWSSFSSNRSYIRIYDPREIEFEITPENLIGILMETTCSKRGLDGQFVYAWHGTELVLLPCGSEEYKKAVTYTERQDQNISAKDLKSGCSYTTKKGEELVYVGRHKWHEYKINYKKGVYERTSKKQYIFYNVKKPQYEHRFFPKDNVSFLASLNNIDPVQNFAEIIDEFNSCPISSENIKWETEPIENFSLAKKLIDQGDKQKEILEQYDYLELDGNYIIFWTIDIKTEFKIIENSLYKSNCYDYNSPIFKGHCLIKTGIFNIETFNYKSCDKYRHSWDYQKEVTPDAEIIEKSKKFVNIFMVLESGKRIQFKSYNSLSQ